MELQKFVYIKSDGRRFIQYHKGQTTAPLLRDEGLVRPADWQAPKLRFNEMRGEWVAVSASRNNRPFLPPKEYCPLCPMDHYLKDSSGNLCKTDVPIMSQSYQWAAFENMFPGLSAHGQTGHCEVILYSPDHSATLAQSSLEQIEGLIQIWQDRSRDVGQMPGIQQVFIFENKGTEVGVTLHHPHGQLYAFQHVPPFLAREQTQAAEHYAQHKQCLVCAIAKKEINGSRLLIQTEDLVAYVPESARYPYEVHITTQQHRPLIEDLTASEVKQLTLILKKLLLAYNKILDLEFPYIMVHHQASHATPDTPSYHWHIEFYPPYRSAGKLKYLAGVESGTGLFINDTVPEEKAAEIRRLIEQLGVL